MAIVVGTGHAGEDILQKAPWAKAARRLRVHVASRIDPERHLAPGVPVPVRGLTTERLRAEVEALRDAAASFQHPYDGAHEGPATPEEVAAEEARLGVSLKMLASMDRRFFERGKGADRRPLPDLRRAFLLYARFFRAFYARTKAKVLVTTQEDDLFSLLSVVVARSMGVRIVGQMVGRFPGRGLMFVEGFSHLMEWAPPPRAAPEELQRLYSRSTVVGDAPRRTQGYWDLAALPKRLRDAAFVSAWEGFRRQAVAVDPAEGLLMPPARLLQEARRHATRVARRYYAGRAGTKQAPAPPYVLFPLHFMDDAQITFREPFMDQELLVRALARALPEGHTLVVKPHPHWGGTDMRVGELGRLAKIPGVVVVDPALPPGPLLERAACVATVNSTLGFEALVQGVPVLTLGHDFYCHDPPCVVVRDMSLLPQGLMEALAARPERRAAGFAFAARTRANTIQVRGEDVGTGHYAFTAEDGAAVAAALEAALGVAKRAKAPLAPKPATPARPAKPAKARARRAAA